MTSTKAGRPDKEKVVGLDICHGHIIASYFSAGRTGPVLKRLSVGTYDPNASDRQIIRAIRGFWKKEKLPTRTVHSCIHSRSLIVRYFRYENLSQDELPQALALEAEEALQLRADQISLDWQIDSIKTNPNESPAELSGTFIAAPRKTVVRHLNLLKAAGLYSIHVEPSCSALSNLYSFITKNSTPQPVCLINLTERTADIIMRSNSSDYPRTLFSASKSWENNMDYLLENIQNALLYYHLKLKNPPIEQIYLTGRIPNPEEFLSTLKRETSLPVEILNLSANPRLTHKKIHLEEKLTDTCNVTTGLGLGIRRSDYDLV